LILLLLVAFAAISQGQVIEDETIDTAMTGEVTAIDAAAKTLTVKGANDEGGVFYVNDKTTILDNSNKPIAFSRLKVGDHVVVDTDTHDGKQVATDIGIVDEPK
jgi:exosome complex RNA-binding protein Rrp42 (RNase PH superfamily)